MERRVAIVTGGGKGIGARYAKALSQNGYRVVIADIDQKAVDATVQEIKAAGQEAMGVQVDVADWQSVEKMANEVFNAYKRIDVLVNNAALYAVLKKRSFVDIPGDEWDKVMAVNVKGIFYCCKAVFPIMKNIGEGRIINISSATVQLGVPGFLHYTSSKAAVVGLTRCLAREVGDYGTTVNAISPGLTKTETNDYLGDAYFENLAQQGCIKRTQEPDDLIGIILFLASKESGFITGQNFVVDGGKAMQ